MLKLQNKLSSFSMSRFELPCLSCSPHAAREMTESMRGEKGKAKGEGGCSVEYST